MSNNKPLFFKAIIITLIFFSCLILIGIITYTMNMGESAYQLLTGEFNYITLLIIMSVAATAILAISAIAMPNLLSIKKSDNNQDKSKNLNNILLKYIALYFAIIILMAIPITWLAIEAVKYQRQPQDAPSPKVTSAAETSPTPLSPLLASERDA